MVMIITLPENEDGLFDSSTLWMQIVRKVQRVDLEDPA